MSNNTLALAWRNVLRNRRRTALTLAAIGVAAVAIVMLGGYVAATIKGLQTITVREYGHLQIMQRGYLEFGRANPARYAIADYEAVIAKLRTDPELAPMLAVVTPTLQVQGVAGHFASGNSSTFLGSGWVAKDRIDLLAWDGLHLHMPPLATKLRADRPEDGVIGVGLAQLLGLCEALEVRNCARMPKEEAPSGPAMGADLAALTQQAKAAMPAEPAGGDDVAIELLAASASGAPNVVRMKVARAEQQGVRDIDRMYASMPLALGQRLVFGPDKPGATAIVVQLARTDQMPAAKARIEKMLADAGQGGGLEVREFPDIAPTYNQVVAMFTTMFGFVAILMGVVSLFSVANTVNMAVSERTGEIGTLRAIGLRRAQVRRMFVVEGGLIGLLGALAGVALALLASHYGINAAGLHWTPPGNAAPVPISIDVDGSTRLCVYTIVTLGVLACISSWWPARRAARLEIVEALRHA